MGESKRSFATLSMSTVFFYFHSKNSEFLKQEIYANLSLYNFRIILANEAAEANYKKNRSYKNKYLYEIDSSSILKLIRKFFSEGIPISQWISSN